MMAKADIESAFRLLPIYPGDFELLGIKFDGNSLLTRHAQWELLVHRLTSLLLLLFGMGSKKGGRVK
jgi:hypothetical protein